MSLKLGKLFVEKLRDNESLMEALGATRQGDELKGARVFMVGRPSEDEDQDKIPYLVLMPAGITSDSDKDACETTDSATMDIMVVANDYPSLVDLTESVRNTLWDLPGDYTDRGYLFIVDDYSFTAGPVLFDQSKPCYYQTLTYVVTTQII